MSQWRVDRTERAEAEQHQAFLDVGRKRGEEWADLWYRGLLEAIEDLGGGLGPRAWHRVEAETERRGVEVRARIYHGPGRRSKRSISYCILYSVADPDLGEEVGQVWILRIVPARGGAAASFLSDLGQEDAGEDD